VKVTADSPPAEISLYELKSIEGTASITIRKQKLIFLFEFVVELYFKA
jgi:activator of HSP90 ATPase